MSSRNKKSPRSEPPQQSTTHKRIIQYHRDEKSSVSNAYARVVVVVKHDRGRGTKKHEFNMRTYHRSFFVEFQTTDAVQLFQINPTFPLHANSVHYERRQDVDLRTRTNHKRVKINASKSRRSLPLTGRSTTIVRNENIVYQPA